MLSKGESVGEDQDLISQISGDEKPLNSNQVFVYNQWLNSKWLNRKWINTIFLQEGDEDDEQVRVDLGKLREFLSRMDTGHHHHRHHQLPHNEVINQLIIVMYEKDQNIKH